MSLLGFFICSSVHRLSRVSNSILRKCCHKKKRSHLLRLSKQSHFFIQDKRRRRDGHMIFPSERHFFFTRHNRRAPLFTKGKKKETTTKTECDERSGSLNCISYNTQSSKRIGKRHRVNYFLYGTCAFLFCECFVYYFLSGNSLGLGGLVQGEE